MAGKTLTLAHEALPWPYLVFFGTVEPVLTIAGALYAAVLPQLYHFNLVPQTVYFLPITAIASPPSLMAVRQLGSCYFLLALLAFFLLPKIHSALAPAHPQALEAIVHRYLLCLAVADVSHIGFTLYDLGWEGSLDVKNWNSLVWGNVGITSMLFLVRMLWFSCLGRHTVTDKKVS